CGREDARSLRAAARSTPRSAGTRGNHVDAADRNACGTDFVSTLLERRDQPGELWIFLARRSRLSLEEPQRLGDVLEEVLLALDLGEESVGAQRLHVALEATGNQTGREARFVERRERVLPHLIHVVGEQSLAHAVVEAMVRVPEHRGDVIR